jgi:hypothetical protein
MTKAICFTCETPDEITCKFIINITGYDLYLIVNNRTVDITKMKIQYPTIIFITIEHEKCLDKDLKHSNKWDTENEISCWDYFFYYFGVNNTTYENIWFIHENVFMYNHETIAHIDAQYITEDLLTPMHMIDTTFQCEHIITKTHSTNESESESENSTIKNKSDTTQIETIKNKLDVAQDENESIQDEIESLTEEQKILIGDRDVKWFSERIGISFAPDRWLYWDMNNAKTLLDADMCPCHSLTYAFRISSRLMKKVIKYAKKKKTLLYVEIMLNTLAEYYDYSIKCPIELSGIRQKPIKNFRNRVMNKYGNHEWIHSDLPAIIKKNYMYYPVGSLSVHKKWRENFNL